VPDAGSDELKHVALCCVWLWTLFKIWLLFTSLLDAYRHDRQRRREPGHRQLIGW